MSRADVLAVLLPAGLALVVRLGDAALLAGGTAESPGLARAALGPLAGSVTVLLAALAATRIGGAAAGWLAGLPLALHGGAVALDARGATAAACVLAVAVAAERLVAARGSVAAGSATRALVTAGVALGAVPLAGAWTGTRPVALAVPTALVALAVLSAWTALSARSARWPGLTPRAAAAALVAAGLLVLVPSMLAGAGSERVDEADASLAPAQIARRTADLLLPPAVRAPAGPATRHATPVERLLVMGSGPLSVPWTPLLAGIVAGLAVGGRRVMREGGSSLLLAAVFAAPAVLCGPTDAERLVTGVLLVPPAAAGWAGAVRVPLPRLRRRLAAGALLAASLILAAHALGTAPAARRGGSPDASPSPPPGAPGAGGPPLVSSGSRTGGTRSADRAGAGGPA